MADVRVRIDKWLWAARFFKTRGLASEAVQGGHVQLNGARIKPGRAVAVGDRLEIKRNGLLFEITVVALSDRRGSASVAATLYDESAESIANREQAIEQKRVERAAAPVTDRRPDKHQRRAITRLRRG
jgi:ribosome-associated heat shock protein Hsp15